MWEGIYPVKCELFETSNLKSIQQHMHHGYYSKPLI